MLSQRQLQVLQPFFQRHESQLQRLKIASISPYISHTSITDQNQLFYSWGQRRIFHSIKMTNQQLKAINEVKTLIIEQQKFLVNEFSDQMILRHLHSTNLDPNSAYQRLKKLYSILNPKQNQISFLKYLQKDNYENIQRNLKSGVIYTLGKSSGQSFPLVVFQVAKLNINLNPQENFAIFYLMICLVIQYRMKPHWQEKYIFLIDLAGLSISQTPYKYMYKFMDLIGIIFAGMCEKILVYNSSKIGMLWQICKRLLPDHTVAKVIFVDQRNVKSVLQIFNPNQLQKKYGGNIENLKQFRPPKQIKQPYVPRNFSNDSVLKSLYCSQKEDDDTTQYFSFKTIPNYSFGISPKKLTSTENTNEEVYEIEKQEFFFQRLNNCCDSKNKNDNKIHFCKFF